MFFGLDFITSGQKYLKILKVRIFILTLLKCFFSKIYLYYLIFSVALKQNSTVFPDKYI